MPGGPRHVTTPIDRQALLELLFKLIDSLSDGVLIFDRDWRFAYLNAVGERVLGRSRESLTGKVLWDEFPELVGTSFGTAYRRAMADQVEVAVEDFYPPFQGWFEARALPTGEGGIMSLFRSVTDRRTREAREQAELRDGRERLRLALESAKLGDWSWEAASDLVTFSERAAGIFGIPPGPLLTWTRMRDLLHPDDRDRARIAVEHALVARQDYAVEYRVIRPSDGQIVWVSALGRGVYDAGDAVVGMIGVVQDVTAPVLQRRAVEAMVDERGKLLQSERQARQQAEEANRLKDDFLATVSHELRTPLSAMLGWINLLKGNALAEERRELALDTIHRNAKSQAQLIEDLLDVSRIISGNLRLEIEPVNVAPIIEQAIETVRPAAEAKSLRLQVALDSDGVVMGDAGRLRQVVWNLLTNAVKFTPKNGRIQVLLTRVSSSVELSVVDNGQGIPPEFLPHAFERFRQASSGSTRVHGGLGLGLSIVRHIVELHGGTVAATSEGEGKGAAFTVRLPLSVAASQRTELSSALGRGAQLPDWSALTGKPDSGGLRVLVVDDEVDTREFLRELLTSVNVEVHVASSAEEGLAAVKAAPPQLLISDIGMPGQDGYSFIRQVRSLPPAEGGSVPAVALTAYARTEDRTRALLSGFHSHVPKPVEPIELIAVISALSRHRS